MDGLPLVPSKTCGNCGRLNHNLGSKKDFVCNHYKYEADRDINAARNILNKNFKLVNKIYLIRLLRNANLHSKCYNTHFTYLTFFSGVQRSPFGSTFINNKFFQDKEMVQLVHPIERREKSSVLV